MGMDVDRVVAQWVEACLQGRMSVDGLLAALEDLDASLPPSVADARPRLTTLKNDVQDAIDDGGQGRDQVQSAAIRFLGASPASVLGTRGAPDWHYEG